MTGQVALMLGVVACAAGEGSFAKGANEEICRQLHQECSEARAQGARDAGICNVERLECTTDPTDQPETAAGKRPQAREARPPGPLLAMARYPAAVRISPSNS